MAEQDVNYASVVIKGKKEPQTEDKEQIVYDEVKVHNKTVPPSDDTKDSAEKEAGRGRVFQLMACCLVTICIISLLAIIGVITYKNQNLKKQIEMMETSIEFNVSRAQWSIDAYCKENGGRCAACQQGWLGSQSSCYAYNDPPPSDQLSWEEARGNCRGKISDLTVVADETEKNFVNTISYSTNPDIGFWIGLRAVEGKWNWIDGSDITNNAWINPPTNNSQCVISVQNKGWKSVNCENKNEWICEKKALSV